MANAAKAAFLFLSALMSVTSALAGESCQSYRSELARLGHGSHGLSMARIAQLNQYKQSMGCFDSGFFVFHSPQCDVADQQINAVRAAGSAAEGNRERRAELRGLIRKYCSLPREAPVETEHESSHSGGGSQLICVRTCDGGYFPLDWSPKKDSDPDALCQALCPGAEAAAYSMPPGDDGLKSAASLQSNAAYSALPNAFKFQKESSPSCSCGSKNASWSQSLLKAEDLLPKHKGDVLVTPELAEQLSRPEAKATVILAKRGESLHVATPHKHHSLRFAMRSSHRHARSQEYIPQQQQQQPVAFSGGSLRTDDGTFTSGTFQ